MVRTRLADGMIAGVRGEATGAGPGRRWWRAVAAGLTLGIVAVLLAALAVAPALADNPLVGEWHMDALTMPGEGISATRTARATATT